jgi:putative permease
MITLTPVFLFFFLKEGNKIFTFMVAYIPERFFRQEFEDVARIANTSTGKYMRAKLISIFFLFLFFLVSFSITFVIFGRLPFMTLILYAALFAMIIALLDLVPYIGPFLGIVLPISFLLIISETNREFLIFSAILIVIDVLGQQLQKLIIEPIVMSKEVDVHPLAVLGGLLFFGSLFGFVGFVIATPLIATINGVRNYFAMQSEEQQERVIINEEIISSE